MVEPNSSWSCDYTQEHTLYERDTFPTRSSRARLVDRAVERGEKYLQGFFLIFRHPKFSRRFERRDRVV